MLLLLYTLLSLMDPILGHGRQDHWGCWTRRAVNRASSWRGGKSPLPFVLGPQRNVQLLLMD